MEFAAAPVNMGIDLPIRRHPPADPFALRVANAIFLPINYGLELGFFLAVGGVRAAAVMRGTIAAEPPTNSLPGRWSRPAS